jgi:hypothetical protein
MRPCSRATGTQNGVLKTVDRKTLPRNDVEVHGALSAVPGQVAGSGNSVELHVTALAASPLADEAVNIYALGSDVPDPTNVVTVDAAAAGVPIIVRP